MAIKKEKACSKCGETLPADCFLVITSKPKLPTHKPWIGLSAECRECRKRIRRADRRRKAAEAGRSMAEYMSPEDRVAMHAREREARRQEYERELSLIRERREKRKVERRKAVTRRKHERADLRESLPPGDRVMTIAIVLTDRDAFRFATRSTRTLTGCLEWQGARNPKGYGSFRADNGHTYSAHRVAYRLANGPIPSSLHVCHHCDNPPCVDPGHLFVGTHADNMQDKKDKGRRSTVPRPTR